MGGCIEFAHAPGKKTNFPLDKVYIDHYNVVHGLS